MKAIRRLAWRKRQRREEGRRGYQVSRDVRVRLTSDPQPVRDQGWIEAGQGQAERSKEEEGEGVPGQGSTWALSRENGGTQGQGSVGNGEDGI